MDVESYTSRIVGYMNGAATCFTLTVAKETGLLSVFINPHQPMTITEIATKANLKQRYVQELLGCLVAARMVEIDDKSEKYHVPDELRTTLQSLMRTVGLLDFSLQRKDDLKDCLNPLGPNGYCSQSKAGYGEALKGVRFMDMNVVLEEEIFSSATDMKTRLESGIDFIEYGCGQAAIILELATRYPNSRFVASDYSVDVITTLAETIKSKNLQNLRAQQADLYNLPPDWTSKFDVAYVRDVMHDLGDPARGGQGVASSIKDDGFVIIIELVIKGSNHKENMDEAFGPTMFVVSSTICIPESLGQSGAAGMGCTTGMEGVKEMLRKSGFSESNTVAVQSKCFPLQMKFVCKKF